MSKNKPTCGKCMTELICEYFSDGMAKLIYCPNCKNEVYSADNWDWKGWHKEGKDE